MNRLPLLLAGVVATAQAAGYRGQPLEVALEDLREHGLDLFYSSDVVRPWMRVEREPRATGPRAVLAEILAPFGITIADGPGDALLLVRAQPRGPRQSAPGEPRRPAPAPLETIVVSASHYRIGDDPHPAVFTTSQMSLLPDLGEDPLRAVSRLPGVAQQDFSARAHIRGGAANETLVLFDDLRLYNPFHFKDFFGLFSTVDPGIISGIRVYTAGFPVNYGDRTSGVIAITPRLPDRPLGGQAVLSLLTTGLALSGLSADGAGDWALAARRGNMDLYLDLADSPLGTPRYHEIYAHFARRFSENLAVAGNVIAFDDRLRAFDSDREERALARYRDAYYWLRADLGATDAAGGRLLLARTRLDSRRAGSVDLPGVTRGWLDDRRHFTIDSVQADGWWHAGRHSLFQAGGEWRRLNGDYRYADAASFALLFELPGAGTDPVRSRTVRLTPSGQQMAVYGNWRFEPSAAIAADFGLRWDRDTLPGRDESHLAPRAVLRWNAGTDTRLRLGWGSYVQSQGIDELQVPDGEHRYHPAQRATHRVVSVEHDLTPSLWLRAEYYRKAYRRPLPRHENLLNSLVVLPELQPDRILVTPESALAEGAEISLQYERENLGGWLNYSRSRVVDRIAGTTVRRSWDQRDYLSGGLSWRSTRWEASLAATWHSGWPTTAIALATLEPFPLVAAGPRNEARIGNYARIDLRLARRFELGSGDRLTAFVEINNLLRRSNDCCVEYELEDLDDEAAFDVHTSRALPLIPSAGFVWKF